MKIGLKFNIINLGTIKIFKKHRTTMKRFFFSIKCINIYVICDNIGLYSYLFSMNFTFKYSYSFIFSNQGFDYLLNNHVILVIFADGGYRGKLVDNAMQEFGYALHIKTVA